MLSEPRPAPPPPVSSGWDLTERLDLAQVYENACRRPVPVAGPAGGFATGPLFRAARAAAVARRRVTGALTVDVLGSAPDLWWYVAVLSRSLWMVTHVTVTADVSTVPPRLADQLTLAGIGLDTSTGPFGASLVVGTAPDGLRLDRLSPGTLLVEAVPGAFAPETHRRAGVLSYDLIPAPAPDPDTERAFAAELAMATT